MTIELGLYHPDYNWKLLKFIPRNFLTSLPLLDHQIDENYNILDWKILSKRYLPGWLFVKYHELIDWPTFISNGCPKEIIYLLKIKNLVISFININSSSYVKGLYYSSDNFISAFQEYIDWDWCVKNIRLSSYVLLKHWNRFDIKLLSKYQTFSTKVISDKKENILWNYAVKNYLSPKSIRIALPYIKWNLLFKYQQLSEDFLYMHYEQIFINRKNAVIVSKYQNLTEKFIDKYSNQLPWNILSKYQNLTLSLLKKYKDKIKFNLLLNNKYFNNDGIKILFHGNVWYVIEPQNSQQVRFLTDAN